MQVTADVSQELRMLEMLEQQEVKGRVRTSYLKLEGSELPLVPDLLDIGDAPVFSD